MSQEVVIVGGARTPMAEYSGTPGYGKLKGEAFRIGHMGDHSVAELQELLKVLEETIA